MKTFITSIVALLATQAAFADGFVCTTLDESLTVKVYNHTYAQAGTRNAAVMVISDNLVSTKGHKTIARFKDANGVLGQSGASYVANVDLRFNDSKRKGELILGTKLGYVDTIALDVAFSYADPVAAGDELAGELTIVKRDGQSFVEDMTCTRYLKN